MLFSDGHLTDKEEEQALLRLFREVRKLIVLDDDYGRRSIDIKRSLVAWCRYRLTSPAYFRDHWHEYNELSYKYIYPVLWWVMQMAKVGAVWELGGWKEEDVDPDAVEKKRIRQEALSAARESGLAKLTAEERHALNL